MIDTGSQVSTVSLSFYNKYFDKNMLYDISGLLRVEHVGGGSIPYAGYFEAEISIPVTTDQNFVENIPILVVPDTEYNSEVPLIIGTNFLKLLNSDLSIPILSVNQRLQTVIHALQKVDRILDESQGVFAELQTLNEQTIPAFSGEIIECRLDKEIPLGTHVALLEEIGELPIVPTLFNLKPGVTSVPVEFYNDSEEEIVITGGEKVAKLHQVTVPTIEKDSAMNKFLDQIDYSHLSDDETFKLKQFLMKNRDVFAMNASEMGCTDIVTHKVELIEPVTPISQKPRPIPPGCYSELREHLNELLNADIIQESKSAWCHNMVFARKKNGDLRLCQDFRPTNLLSRVDKYSYSIPRIETLIDCLKGAKIFVSLDLFAGYHQVKMFEPHMERTAFSAGPLGFFEYKRMCFGLQGAPSTFQRLMDKVLQGLTMRTCCVYLDDVIVFATNEEELYRRLNEVFDRLRQANLKLKPKKCEFFLKSIEFLGHRISEAGVECTDRHIEAVLNWPEPTNVKELQRWLGFINFYRRFISGFSNIVSPLTQLLKGHGSKKKKYAKIKCFKSKSQITEPAPWRWDREQQEAFEQIKTKLTTPPVLAYPDFDKPFVLHTDASRNGLGAVLYQEDEHGKLRVIAYGSRSLSKSESNYSAHKLEFLALKWAVTSKFSYYLRNQTFKVYTDHNPLVYLTTTAKLDALGHRWLADLSSYHFEVFYKPGKLNSDADGLSRRPYPEQEMQKSTKQVSEAVFQELCKLLTTGEFEGVAESLGVSPSIAQCQAMSIGDNVTEVDWKDEQSKDPDIKRMIELLKQGKRPDDKQRHNETAGVMRLISHWDSLIVKKQVLYKKSHFYDSIVTRLVVPRQMQDEVLRRTHEEIGHLGRDKTLSIAQERFFWIGLARSVEEKVRHCSTCLRSKAPYLPQYAPLCSIETTRPLELVCMDFLSLEESKGGYKYILVVTDHYTKYAIAYPTRNQEAKTVAKILVEHFIVHYGIPERCHSDRGGSFEGKIIHHLCSMLGVSKSKTSPYHAMGNGVIERYNRTLLSMLRTLDADQKLVWKEHLASLVHAYNCTRHESTGYSPFFLMFGRKPRLAVDIFLGLTDTGVENQAIKTVRRALEDAYRAATEAARQARKKQKRGYDKRIRGKGLQVGDFVLVRNVGLKGKQKLANKWQTERFIVKEQPNEDIPVFKVENESGGKPKMLHRNMLLPLELPRLYHVKEEKQVEHVVRRTRNVGKVKVDEKVNTTVSDLSDDESLDDVCIQIHFNQDLNANSAVHTVEDEVAESSDEQLPSVADEVEAEVVEEALDLQDPSAKGDETDNVAQDPEVEDEADEYVQEVRRSGRERNPPERLGIGQQRVSRVGWKEKILFLLRLVDIFPWQKADICSVILYIVAHA